MKLPKLEVNQIGSKNYIIQGYESPLETREEAAEIIRRVEAHDGLVVACRETLLGWNEFVKVHDAAIKVFYKRLENAEQALSGEPTNSVEALAKKAATTGNHSDLQAYLKERQNKR